MPDFLSPPVLPPPPALPDDLVSPVEIPLPPFFNVVEKPISATLECINPEIEWPSITLPGLPNFIMSTLLAQFAGIQYILKFIPPDPKKLPKPPSINIFLEAFMAGINIPPFPQIPVIPPLPPFPNLPSIPVIPPLPNPLKIFMDLITAIVKVPFEIIKKMVKKILSLAIPTIESITKMIVEAISSIIPSLPPIPNLTLPELPILQFSSCLAKSIFSLLTSFIPV